ncbi:RagB/SusD family nutrient uptake outer membrane protein [Tenacibaculum sp.]|uniref:RagB/SusD family nutrient uptake outer membrane protein n=1 Tax=Tenacibaculum sp. TaxID=1906242 RepID=UPI003D135CC8
MKNIKTKIISIAILSVMLLVGSCTNDILEETPRSIFTPDFFKTELGVQGGITALYTQLRYSYGNMGYYTAKEDGTDEYAYGASGQDDSNAILDFSGRGGVMNAQTGAIGDMWFNAFPAINTASGIIENATEVGLSDALIAEARFFRSFNYFQLVQNYGGVPLDLGAGELKFNTSTNRGSVRNTVPEVYTKGIFPDLLTAINDLPVTPRLTGTVTKNVARLYLAKAYLTYGWWLQNPNNIPTYPEAPRTDPDGHDPAWYFQQAYTIALEGINNPGPYALQEYFYDVHWAPNDRHSEMMLYADHTEDSEKYNGASLSWGNSTYQDNSAVWLVTWNYTFLDQVDREAAQDYGRPWTRLAPPHGVFKNTFKEKEFDSRYDGTFVTVYRNNRDKSGDYDKHPNANGLLTGPGDAVFTFLKEENPAVDFTDGNATGGGTLPGRADYVINPSGFNRIVYPGLWKLGTYRTDNEGGLGSPNAGSTRPFPIAKFSEFYFVAAEAAVKGASGSMTAKELINVIRARAGKWRYNNAEKQEFIADFSEDMKDATPANIDIDYILEERSREYFGEGYRWLDLVRTQKWAEIAGTYEISGTGFSDRTPQVVTRTIEPYNYLRPIPQGQLDSMEATEAEKAAYQNPGY